MPPQGLPDSAKLPLGPLPMEWSGGNLPFSFRQFLLQRNTVSANWFALAPPPPLSLFFSLIELKVSFFVWPVHQWVPRA